MQQGRAALGPRLLRWLSATRRAQFTASLTCALLFGVFFGALVVANIRSTAPAPRDTVNRTARIPAPVPVPVRVRVTEQQRLPPASQSTPSNGVAVSHGSGGDDSDAIAEKPSDTPQTTPIDELRSDPAGNSLNGAAVDRSAAEALRPVLPETPAIQSSEPTAPEKPAVSGEPMQRTALKSEPSRDPGRDPGRESAAKQNAQAPKAESAPVAPPRAEPAALTETGAQAPEPTADQARSGPNSASAPSALPGESPVQPQTADSQSPLPMPHEPESTPAKQESVLTPEAVAALGSEVIDARSAGAAQVVEPDLTWSMPPLEMPDLIEAPAKAGDPPTRMAALPAPGGGQWLKNAVTMPPSTGRPMIAIVIDDVGINQRRSRRTIDLPAPLTLSFIPYGYNLRTLVASARNAGHEILVHIPMEPLDKKWNPGPNALLTSQDDAEILRRLRWGLNQFDGYVGVSNHMGSKFTAWRPGMTTVLREIRSRGLLFLDSWTSNRSLGFAMSREIDMPSAARDIFIDHDVSREEIRGNLGRLERIARRRGFAIGIGHPHDLTTSMLAKWIDRVRSRGIDLVPISSIVRRRLGAG